jgi:hypothetical protein
MNMVNIDKAIETEGFRQALKDKVCSRKDFKKNWQNIHTPFNLCKEIAGKLVEFTGLDNKIILTLNLEFLEIMVYGYGVKRENIWFLTDCEEKAKVIKHPRYAGVNVIIANYLEWKTDMLFDIICGNPPYNSPDEENKVGFSETLWEDFVKKSLSLLKEGGFLCLIHPGSWRKPEHELWPIITKNQIFHLEIHGSDDGRKTFGCLTRYDWYILQKRSCYEATTIIDELGNASKIDLRNCKFLPNFLIKEVSELLVKNGEKSCEILRLRSYDAEREWVSDKKSKKFCHPIIRGIRAENNGGVTIHYTSRTDKGGFDTPKVIVSNTGNMYALNDFDGKYSFSCLCFGIISDTKENAELMTKALSSKKWNEIIKATKWCNGPITDHKMFSYFRKDFWKAFTNE